MRELLPCERLHSHLIEFAHDGPRGEIQNESHSQGAREVRSAYDHDDDDLHVDDDQQPEADEGVQEANCADGVVQHVRFEGHRGYRLDGQGDRTIVRSHQVVCSPNQEVSQDELLIRRCLVELLVFCEVSKHKASQNDLSNAHE